MSRSNPYKLKPRRPKTTVLAVGEGENDASFLEYLKSLYVVRGCGTHVKVDHAYGGSPETIVREAIKKMTRAEYDRAFLLLDTDTAWPQSATQAAREKSLTLVGSVPCLEGMILEILEPGQQWSRKASRDCKSHFQRAYLNQRAAYEAGHFAAFLQKTAIENAKTRIEALRATIELITPQE